MPSSSPGIRVLWLSLTAAAVCALSYSPLAQSPPAGGQAASGQTPAAEGSAGQPAPGAAAPAGPGGFAGRGRGMGGPGADDPINADVDYSPRTPVTPLTPEEQAKHFVLPEGYRLELVLAEPHIDEPTAIAFDGNGRMFVLEDRGYMQDADATGELDPIGRISMHEDRDGDGAYERHTVFVDNLVFPRFVTPFGADAILTMESNADEVWKLTDTDGDGVADRKELFTTNFGRSGNVEHQQAFLMWGMDNWLYSTVNAFRVRWTPNGILREPTGPNGAQWGATQDDDGKIWFLGGASGLPSYFQFPIHYGTIPVPQNEQFEEDFAIPWGAPVRIADMQGGMGAVRMPDGSLNRVTGSAGNDIVRAHRLPADIQGDLLYGEPIARIVRRVKPVVSEGVTQLRNAYLYSEFIKSTDPLFRPVDMTTAPDGTVYITDMYRGIIQQATWSGPGTYLRKRIEQYGLDRVHSRGRIWRLRYEGMDRDRTQPRMLEESPAQLVAHLGHPNGWWRDTAQQLLVLQQDRSVVPALQQLARTSSTLVERFHALWTLEGLGALDAALVRSLMKDPNPRMRIQAVRASETLFKGGDRSLADDYRALTGDADVNVAIQALLTLSLSRVPDLPAVVKKTMAANKARGVQIVGGQLLQNAADVTYGSPRGGRGGPPAFSPAELETMKRGDTIYKELCFSCHGDDGRGAPVPGTSDGSLMGPPLAAGVRVQGHRDYVIKTLLHGLTGPLDGRSYPTGVMAPMGTNSDDWIAAIGSYVRNAFGNVGSFITAADVARVRAASPRTSMWTVEELLASLPRALTAQPSWKATASHNAEAAADAFNFGGWTSRAPQEPGMWFQVELPEAVSLTEIEFVSPGGFGFGGRGRGGRGGAPGAPGPPQAGPPASAGAAAAAQAPGAQAPGAQPPSSGAAPAGAPPAGMMAGGLGGGRGGALFPRAYKVEVSADGSAWRQVAAGVGTAGTMQVAFEPVRAKFVRITQTETVENAPNWTIQRLRLYEEE